MALSKLTEEERSKSSQLAAKALVRAQKWGLVANVGENGGIKEEDEDE